MRNVDTVMIHNEVINPCTSKGALAVVWMVRNAEVKIYRN